MRGIVSSRLAIQCLSMEDKKNYQEILQNTIKNLENTGNKPKLLLHACCGPCFTLPHEILCGHFNITIIYNNSNIYPKEEYKRRLNELKRFISDVSKDIKIIEIKYDNSTYNKILEPYKDYPEGSLRCQKCFEARLEYGYRYAVEHHFDYFGTVMTISRYKNSQVINRIGKELEKRYPSVKWLLADFKKNNGYERSLKIVREHEMYFQDYCGCIYSYQKRQEKLKK